jgi:hypothetical protein
MEAFHENAGIQRCHLTEVNARPTIVTLKRDGTPMAIIRVESGTSLVWCVRFPNMQLSSGAFANSQRAMDWLASGRPLLCNADSQSYSAFLKAASVKHPEGRAAEFEPTDKESGLEPGAVDRTDRTNTALNTVERKIRTGPQWQPMDWKIRTDRDSETIERKTRIGPEWQTMTRD